MIIDQLATLPYGRQWIDDADVAAVVDCLHGDWLTQGPLVADFEEALCRKTGAKFAVVVSSGTAALHLAAVAAGVGPGDYGVCPAITFVASANCIALAGGRVRLTDVDAETGLLDVESLRATVAALCERGLPPKIIVPVHMCGQPVDMPAIRSIADSCGAFVLEDACHALGAQYHDGQQWQATGSCRHSDATVFSFHPVKHVTSGEGGAVLTNDKRLAERVRQLRSHGIHKEPPEFEVTGEGPWYYEQTELGLNYRITDLQCALGLSQLSKLDDFVQRRQAIADVYDDALGAAPWCDYLQPLKQHADRQNAYHLYVVRVVRGAPASRRHLFDFLAARGIRTQVHYIPVSWQPYYRHHHDTKFEDCPQANAYYESCLSLPVYPRMSDSDVGRVVSALHDWCAEAAKAPAFEEIPSAA